MYNSSSIPGLGRAPGEGIGYHSVFLRFPWGSAGKESACSVGDLGLIPGLGRSPGEWRGYPLQYSHLGNSMDCICIVHGVAKNQTRLSDFHFHFMQPKLRTSMHNIWRRRWHPTPVVSPGESQGRRGLVGCSPWGC